jgi:large subunit ribosomal protein L28
MAAGTGAARSGGARVVCYPCSAMAAVCDICGKKPFFGMRVSHSHHRTKRRWDPNIQRVRAVVNGAPKRVNACTSCIKAGKVRRAL